MAQTLKSFVIYGDVSKVTEPVEQVVLNYFQGDEVRIDTSIVKNGKYIFKGKISESQLMSIYTLGENFRMVQVYVDPVDVYVTSDSVFSEAKINGSASQIAFQDYIMATKFYRKQMDSLVQIRNAHEDAYEQSKNPEDSIGALKNQKQLNELLKKEMELTIHYANEHMSSPVIVDVVYSIGQPEYNEKREVLFNQLPEDKKKSRLGRELAREIAIGIGHTGPDFSLPDTAGKMVQFSSFRGKYVLLDFWASWCVPCRAESPYLLAAYKKYKTKGFTIFAVSHDKADAKKAWLNAIKKDGTGIWTQTSSLTGKYNAASMAYGLISSLPSNFLIDPDGKIIAKNLRGEALDKKLSEIFN